MATKELRSIWLVTKDGTPYQGVWAMVKTDALQAWQAEADGWDATPTQWRRMPHIMYGGVMRLLTPVATGRNVVVGGLSYNLDLAGRPHPTNTEASPREPLCPDTLVASEADLLAAAELLGRDVCFIEKATLKTWRATPDQAQARGPSDDVLIKRQGGQVNRSNRP